MGMNHDSMIEEIMEMIQDLCDLSGYGIHSGINIGKKARGAAEYIKDRLQQSGLHDVRLDPIQVNNPFPDSYGLSVLENGKKIDLSDSCYPILWTAGTSAEGVTGELVNVGEGSVSQFRKKIVSGKIALIYEKFIRGWIPSAREGAHLEKRMEPLGSYVLICSWIVLNNRSLMEHRMIYSRSRLSA